MQDVFINKAFTLIYSEPWDCGYDNGMRFDLVIGSMQDGEIFTVLGSDGEFLFVLYPNGSGWMLIER